MADPTKRQKQMNDYYLEMQRLVSQAVKIAVKTQPQPVKRPRPVPKPIKAEKPKEAPPKHKRLIELD